VAKGVGDTAGISAAVPSRRKDAIPDSHFSVNVGRLLALAGMHSRAKAQQQQVYARSAQASSARWGSRTPAAAAGLYVTGCAPSPLLCSEVLVPSIRWLSHCSLAGQVVSDHRPHYGKPHLCNMFACCTVAI
jgi:hypothetical protein